MISHTRLDAMHQDRMRNRQKVSSDSNVMDYKIMFGDLCLLSSDYDLMLVKNKGVLGYVNDIQDLTREKLNDLAYVSVTGKVVSLSGKGKYVIDGVRKKHDGEYASVYYDPALQQSRCYHGIKNDLVISDFEKLHCCYELVGDVAYLLQGESPNSVTIGDKIYTVDSNEFQFFDSCIVDPNCEGYILKIAGQLYRCKFKPSYDVLVMKNKNGHVHTSDNRILKGDYPVDSILEITFDGEILRQRYDVYIYNTKNPIPSSASMFTLLKFMQNGDSKSFVETPCACEGVQDESQPAVNIIDKINDDFDVQGTFFSDLLSYVSKPGYVFYPSEVRDILFQNNILIRNGIIKGSMLASKVIPYVKYKEHKASTVLDIICSMYSNKYNTNGIIEYFFKRHMFVGDDVMDKGALQFLASVNKSLVKRQNDYNRLKNMVQLIIYPYFDGYYVSSSKNRLFVSATSFIIYDGPITKPANHSWCRRMNDVVSSLDFDKEPYLLKRVMGVPRDTCVVYPPQYPDSHRSTLGGYSVKLIYKHVVCYANLHTGECVIGDKVYSALYEAFSEIS